MRCCVDAKIVEHMTALPLKRLETLSNFQLPLKQLWRPKKKKAKKKCTPARAPMRFGPHSTGEKPAAPSGSMRRIP